MLTFMRSSQHCTTPWGGHGASRLCPPYDSCMHPHSLHSPMVVGPPAASMASLASAKFATCSADGFLSLGMCPFSMLFSIVYSVRDGSYPPLIDQTQFLVKTSMAYSTASAGFSVALAMIGTTLALSR